MQTRPGQERRFTLLTTLALSIFAFAVAGYHPYAEDGGVYVAGVEKLLRPELFPAWTDFVTEPLRFSLFAPLLAALVRFTHASLPVVLLAVYFAGIWATLLGGWMLATRCVASLQGRLGAVALLACWLTLPVAGTSLILMDPCVTARTLSTPLLLMALAWALDRAPRSWCLCGLALAAAALVHPLMAGYGLAAVLLVACLGARNPHIHRAGTLAFVLLALALAGAVQALAPPESADYLRVAVTRYYWFVARWRWFEWLGLAGPVAVLAILNSRRPDAALARHNPAQPTNVKVLSLAMIALALTAFAIASCLARESLPTHLVARMQPLRCFQQIYLVMTLLLGAWAGEVLLRARLWRWLVMLALLGGLMASVQRDVYANSAYVEWPGQSPRNPWAQAFVWVRQNTPVDAVFALDAHYITQGHQEDAQCFRAWAERSALPDYSKDGGEASIAPDLTPAWIQGQTAQANLETESDAVRSAMLKPLRATWIILDRASSTDWDCPYTNARVKVCRVP